MIYKETRPGKQLQKYVKYIWIQESDIYQPNSDRQRIMPDGCIEIVIHYRKPFNTYFPNNTCEIQPKSFIVTQVKDYIELEPRGKIGMIGVRFYPWGIHHFLKYTFKEIGDKVIDLNLLWGSEARILEEKIWYSESHIEKVKIVEDFLLDKLQEDTDKIKITDYAIQIIYSSRGKASMDMLMKELRASARYTERLFKSMIGTTPKFMIRLNRFLNVCSCMERKNPPSLTRLAQDYGYYDQSHFNKEFKAFSGLTPKQFLLKNNVFFADTE